MENFNYFDFSAKIGNDISAILTKKNNISNCLSKFERIKFISKQFNIDSNYLGIPLQTHSNNCKIIKGFGSYENTDGLITENEKIILSLSVADCCPVFIYDGKLKIKGLIHSGWQGTINKICNNAIDKFLKLNSDLSRLKIYLGPAIGSCCYEVGHEVAKYFYDHCKIKKNNGRYFVNIREQIKSDLIEIGLKVNQIKKSSICTLENSECESYRRENEKSGRMTALFGDFRI